MRTRQATDILEAAKSDVEWNSLDLAVNYGQNFRQVKTGLFLVNRRCSQEARGIFYEVNLIRINPQLDMMNPRRNSLGYARFYIDQASKELLATALHMHVRVQYVTMELVVNELKTRTDLKTVEIKFCDSVWGKEWGSIIEPFKIFSQIDMSGGTVSQIKNFSIERVKAELDPDCDLSTESSRPCSQDVRDFWDNIKEVVEGRRTDCMTENMFAGFPRKPKVGPWL